MKKDVTGFENFLLTATFSNGSTLNVTFIPKTTITDDSCAYASYLKDLSADDTRKLICDFYSVNGNDSDEKLGLPSIKKNDILDYKTGLNILAKKYPECLTILVTDSRNKKSYKNLSAIKKNSLLTQSIFAARKSLLDIQNQTDGYIATTITPDKTNNPTSFAVKYVKNKVSTKTLSFSASTPYIMRKGNGFTLNTSMINNNITEFMKQTIHYNVQYFIDEAIVKSKILNTMGIDSEESEYFEKFDTTKVLCMIGEIMMNGFKRGYLAKLQFTSSNASIAPLENRIDPEEVFFFTTDGASIYNSNAAQSIEWKKIRSTPVLTMYDNFYSTNVYTANSEYMKAVNSVYEKNIIAADSDNPMMAVILTEKAERMIA